MADFIADRLGPAEPAGGGPGDADLDALRVRLADPALDEPTRARVSAGLRALLAELDAPPPTGGEAVAAIRDAGDDDLFDFIDNKLGVG